MREKKALQAAKRYALPALVLLLVAVFFLYVRGRVQTEFIELRPEDGVLDVRSVDFSDKVYHVVNQWDYYPGRLYMPNDFAGSTSPQKHNNAPLDTTLGTWRLVMLAEPHTYLSLCSFSIDYGARIFVNGKEVRNIGFVSDDPAKAVPKVRFVTLPLYFDETGAVEIVYQYSNFIHNDAGFIQSTSLSTPENIDEYQRALALNAMVLSGGLLMLFFYFLLCAAFQKNREYAALALCCLVIALRNQFFFSEHFLLPTFDFYLAYRTQVLDVSWIPASAFYLVSGFYPKPMGKKAVLAFTGVFAVLSILHYVLPMQRLVALCHVCYYVCVPFIGYVVFRFARYFHKEQKLTPLDVMNLLAILLFVVMLILEGVSTGSNSTVNHFGITPLAMVVCILLLAIVNNETINRQKIQLEQAQQRNKLLLQLNATNNDFLRTVAHELKTPLTVISGYAQLIEFQMQNGPLSKKTPERLKTIRSEADRLAQMVTRLMDYTYGKTRDAEMTAVDINALFASAAAIMTPVCEKKQNALIFQNDSASQIHGNAELLLQVLINLIVNASRHTECGQITVKAADGEGFVSFTVSDTGEGIAPDALPHIFEKGYSTDGSRGLGLSVCRDTVWMHGGELALFETSTKGTKFGFTVPKEEAP